MSAVAVVEPRRSLDDLAVAARNARDAMRADLASALHHAFVLGEVLWAAHDQIDRRSEWDAWLRDNVGLQAEGARRYEELYAHRDLLPPEAFSSYRDERGNLRSPTFTSAWKYLRGLPELRHELRPHRRGSHNRISDEVKQEVKRLVEGGMSCNGAARMVGVSESVARLWVVPGAVEKDEERRRVAARKSKAAKAALRRELDSKAARNIGGGISEVYANTRKSLQIAQRILDDVEETPKVRRELNALIADLHRVEDRTTAILKMGGAS